MDEAEVKKKDGTSTTEYFTSLERWVQEAYMWQCMNAWFPYMLLSQQAAALQVGPVSGPSLAHQPATQQHLLHNTRLVQHTATPLLGVEYKVAPLWKRFTAEFLDFLILFSLKLVITLIAVDIFEFIDLEKYDLDILQSNNKVDYQMALQMTSEILVLEIIHRIAVCAFEGLCLYQGSEGRVGGATPGKNTMGIKVIRCDRVIARGDTVLVYPATDLGLATALWRSFVKNMILAFFFPICLSMLFFQNNRSAYDVLCRTIVVEDTTQQQQQQAVRQQ